MKRYYALLNFVLIAGAVYFSVNAFYIITSARLDSAYPTTVATKPVGPPEGLENNPFSYYKTIMDRNLFNTKTGTGRDPDKIDIETLKPTELKLKLLGTVTGDKDKAYAVIVDPAEKRQNLYRAGDTIQNATLKVILREKVVLRVDGRDEILEIEEDRAGEKTIGLPKRSTTAGPQNLTLKRSQIQAAVDDVNTLMKQVRIRPHFTDGKPDGLRLTGIRPNSIFRNMGLRSGDIITGVNGKPIESVDDALKFYQSLQSSSNVQLQLKRRGREKTIDYTIE